MEDFCNRLKRGDNVIVRIHPTEKNSYPDDDYFVAHLLEKTHKLTEGGVYGTNHFQAGWYVAKIKWYDRKETEENGDRWYKLSSEQTLQCNAFVRSITRPVQLQFNRSKQMYKLEYSLDDHIQRYGALS